MERAKKRWKDKAERVERKNLEEHFVNLHRQVFSSNVGLWTKDIAQMTNEQLEDGIACFDMALKLRETHQVYIVGHDIPLSISSQLFWMLNTKRVAEAKKRNLPLEQYEFEDLIGLFLGIGQ